MNRLLVIAVLALAACGPPAKLSEVESQVFTPSCVFSSCHKGASGAGGLSLEGKTYARIVGVSAVDAPNRTLVVAGDLTKSYLYEKLTKATPQAGVQMPQGGVALDAQSVEMVRSWIADGAKDN